MIHGSWNIRCHRQKFLSFWAICCPFSLKNWKIEKKNTWTYHFTHLHHKWQSYDMYGSWDMESNRQNFLLFWNVYHKWKSYDVWFLRYGAQQMDRQKKWHIEVGTPPKNSRKMLLSSKMLITSCVNRWCQLRGKAEKCPVLSTWVVLKWQDYPRQLQMTS